MQTTTRLSDGNQLSSSELEGASTPPVYPPWRGASPGILGWMLNRVELLGPRIELTEKDRLIIGSPRLFGTVCPLCSNPAHILGPPRGEELNHGDLICVTCEENYPLSPGEASSTELYNDALEITALQLGFKTMDAAVDAAVAELEDALPSVIDLASSRSTVVVQAVAALDRYECCAMSPDEVGLELLECVRWCRAGRPIDSPPRSVISAVSKRIQLRAARRVATAAITRACLEYGTSSITTEDLCGLEPEAIVELSRVLGHRGPLRERNVAYLLRLIVRRPDETGPGIVPVTRKSHHEGTSWQVKL